MKHFIKRLSPYHLFLVIVAISALAFGLTSGVLSNYFKEVYQTTAYQRGLIEFPRELPGILVILVIAFLSGFSDIRLAMVSQVLALLGILSLGLFTPTFNIMLIFIFINSLGHHLNMPVQDALGMSLIEGKTIGKHMGQYKGVQTAFAMVSGIIIFVGFKANLFSFSTPIKWIFILSALVSVVALVLLIGLDVKVHKPLTSNKRVRFVFKKKYKYFYSLVVLYGVQKQIMLVYGPWVLIELLNKKADTIAILGIIGSFIGMFFIPKIGDWVDRFGLKKLLFADALSFIGVYLLYGFISAGFSNGSLATIGLPVFIAYTIFIFDRMSNQMGMIRTLYLRHIADDPADIMPSLSLGLGLDHFVSITCAIISGLVWGKFGPEYIFYGTAVLSLFNVYVAYRVKI